ncbi:hypothetical protein [Neobacillus sp. PS2-9]|uniref:hypothetical protein n=1 Tax=Neobacillus sp. PS2-9 TaxID=3070676 RepID=UPI0027E0E8F4|nr:hypothetical protein [Neobacillus sp. PS2-9]WML58550.1 hypothetical protein RCG25_01795 [Neobacillus sp. PS2-9]
MEEILKKKKVFNQRFIEPVTNLYYQLETFNSGYFVVIPQAITRCYFFDTNNTFSVFVALISWFDENGQRDVSRSILAEHSRVTVRTLDKALKELVSKGFISKKGNAHNNEKDANTYTLSDLTKNPYIILSEAIYTTKYGIRDARLRDSIENFVYPLQKEKSPLLKRIEVTAENDITTAYIIACEAVARHLRDELGINIETPIKREIPLI